MKVELAVIKQEHEAFLTAYPAFRGKLSRSDKATHDAWFRVWYVRATIAKQTGTEWQEVLDNVEPINNPDLNDGVSLEFR